MDGGSGGGPGHLRKIGLKAQYLVDAGLRLQKRKKKKYIEKIEKNYFST